MIRVVWRGQRLTIPAPCQRLAGLGLPGLRLKVTQFWQALSGETMRKTLWVMALLVLGGAAQAESEATKKELIAKLLRLQQPAVEFAAQTLAEQPAKHMLQQAGVAIQSRVEPGKRDFVAQEIQADVRRYVDDAVPLMRERAVRLAPLTIGALMNERFSEAELRQLIAIIESPVNRKYLQMGVEMHRALMDRLVDEMKATIEPKLKLLERSMIKSLDQHAIEAPGAKAPATDK